MAQHFFDLIVIGSGPAGLRAAVQAAKLKKSVLVVEHGRRVGGVCVHTEQGRHHGRGFAPASAHHTRSRGRSARIPVRGLPLSA
jgi:phytoene dehydrogenase-like protein